MLGIKTVRQADRPSFYVPRYLEQAEFNVIPVPVYYAKVTEILGRNVYHRLINVPVDIDLVNIFLRARNIHARVQDMLAEKLEAVWFQSGIRNDVAVEPLAGAGV